MKPTGLQNSNRGRPRSPFSRVGRVVFLAFALLGPVGLAMVMLALFFIVSDLVRRL